MQNRLHPNPINLFLCVQSGKFETLETRKDGTKFTSKALRQAATQLQTFSGQYESRQGHLVEQVGLPSADTDADWM